MNRKMQVIGRTVCNGQIHLSAVQPFNQMASIAFHDAQRDIWKFRDDPAGQPPRQHGAYRRDQAKDDPSGGSPARRLNIVANLFDLAHQTGGAVEQHPTGARQQHATSVADEEFNPKLVLEQLDMPAESRLSGAQPICRLAQTPELRDGPEGTQLL